MLGATLAHHPTPALEGYLAGTAAQADGRAAVTLALVLVLVGALVVCMVCCGGAARVVGAVEGAAARLADGMHSVAPAVERAGAPAVAAWLVSVSAATERAFAEMDGDSSSCRVSRLRALARAEPEGGRSARGDIDDGYDAVQLLSDDADSKIMSDLGDMMAGVEVDGRSPGEMAGTSGRETSSFFEDDDEDDDAPRGCEEESARQAAEGLMAAMGLVGQQLKRRGAAAEEECWLAFLDAVPGKRGMTIKCPKAGVQTAEELRRRLARGWLHTYGADRTPAHWAAAKGDVAAGDSQSTGSMIRGMDIMFFASPSGAQFLLHTDADVQELLRSGAEWLRVSRDKARGAFTPADFGGLDNE